MLWYTISLPYSCCISGNILVSLYLCIPITYFSLLPSVSRRQSKIPASVRLIHRLWCIQAEFVAVLSQNPGPSTAINIFTATSTWPRTPQLHTHGHWERSGEGSFPHHKGWLLGEQSSSLFSHREVLHLLLVMVFSRILGIAFAGIFDLALFRFLCFLPKTT